MKNMDVKQKNIEKIIDDLLEEKPKEREYISLGVIMPNDVKHQKIMRKYHKIK